MSFASYIARRYFFAKTTRNAVNVISAISIGGILVGTMALIIVLSAFNGLETLVKGFYTTFDPDLRISPSEGKYFSSSDFDYKSLNQLEGVESSSNVLQERVLLTYRDKEYIATLKGVDENYNKVTQIDSAITHGTYGLFDNSSVARVVMGAGVSYYLSYGRIIFEDAVQVFVPRRGASAADFQNAFSSQAVYPSGIFSVQPEFDERYVLANRAFVADLLNREHALSSIEVKVKSGWDIEDVQEEIKTLAGPSFKVENREEQQAVFLKVMKSESLFTFLVFALILAIASFTIMGSLSMMMLDKKEHIKTLWALGTEISVLRQIFFREGLLISFAGGGLGLLLGIGLVVAQQYFGLLEIGDNYVVSSYPVELRFSDVLMVIATVAAICGISSWLTSRRLSLTFLKEQA